MFKKKNQNKDRFEFLQGLFLQYKSSKSSIEEKQELIAHLANFAYDPGNRTHFFRVSNIKILQFFSYYK